jgi:hypothetical protein
MCCGHSGVGHDDTRSGTRTGCTTAPRRWLSCGFSASAHGGRETYATHVRFDDDLR